MAKISKKEATKWKIYGVREAMELYQDCRKNNQTEAEAIESVLLYAQSIEWQNY